MLPALLAALAGCSGDATVVRAPGPEGDESLAFTAVTFNCGTSEGLPHDRPPDDGYTSGHAAISDRWYGDGLAWTPAVEATERFLRDVDPDVVVFQEIFWSDACADIPEEAREDFVCEDWSPGDPTVVRRVLGQGWQILCHPGKPDKCAAVNRRFGSFRGCDADFCLEGLEGSRVEGCGSGSRVGRGVLELVGGGTLTLVSVHGSSGISGDDMACRTRQFDQVFVDLGDGDPAASGDTNLVMGDLNTDPGRVAGLDPSAARWNEFAGPAGPFHFVTEVGWDAVPTYAGIFNIDHVVSDRLSGACWAAGITEGHAPVTEAVYVDHHPVVCRVVSNPGGAHE